MANGNFAFDKVLLEEESGKCYHEAVTALT